MVDSHQPKQIEIPAELRVSPNVPLQGRFERLTPARGYFDPLNGPGEEFHVTGWMLSPPTTEIEAFALYVGGELVSATKAQKASAAYDRVRGAGIPKLFGFYPPLKQKEIPRFSRVEVLGVVGEGPVSRITTMFRGDLYS